MDAGQVFFPNITNSSIPHSHASIIQNPRYTIISEFATSSNKKKNFYFRHYCCRVINRHRLFGIHIRAPQQQRDFSNPIQQRHSGRPLAPSRSKQDYYERYTKNVRLCLVLGSLIKRAVLRSL